MSDVHNKSPRPPRNATQSGSSPAVTPPAPKQFQPSSAGATAAQSPRLREKAAGAKGKLLPARQKEAGCLPVAPAKARPAAGDSPYRVLSPKSRTPARGEAASPRKYLQTLNGDSLTNTILRDQTIANGGVYPSAWIGEVQASLEEQVSRLLGRAPEVGAAMPGGDLDRLYPAVGAEANFKWRAFEKLCGQLWPAFSAQLLDLDAVPPKTLGFLAQLQAELESLPAFRKLQPAQRDKCLSNALFNLLVWNGILSPLTRSVPAEYQRLVSGLCTYVKTAFGLNEQSQGSIGKPIAGLVTQQQTRECAAFFTALKARVKRLAEARTVAFDDLRQDQALNDLRERNMEHYFTGTWLGRKDDHARVLEKGCYFLTGEDGATTRCTSYHKLKAYVGAGDRDSLPEVVLHVAGERIKNFLCHTYLYDTPNPLFTDADGQRIDPVPNLAAEFTLNRNSHGRITVAFSCVDDAVGHVMVTLPGDDGPGVDATPLFPASLAFHGEMHFYPNEEFEAGEIRLAGQNFHLVK